ncbi:MAG: FxsA family protein, partial [Verrucomicrobiota bacterium]
HTLGLVVFTGFLGAALARFQGLRVLHQIRADLALGKMPAPYLMDGVMILLAGAVLITPGLITDAAGFLLLVPAVRQLLKEQLKKKIEEKLRKGTIEVTYRES